MLSELAAAQRDIQSYVAQGELLFQLMDQGKVSEAMLKLDAFQKRFSDLEQSLEKLGNHIEDMAETSVQESEQDSQKALAFGMKVSIFGILITFLSSVAINLSTVRALRKNVASLSDQRKALRVSAFDAERTSTILTHSTHEQAVSLQRTASATEQIGAVLKRTSENSQELSERAKASTTAVREGQLAVEQVLDEMKSIDEGNSKVMQQLEDGNKQMAGIINIIRQIGDRAQVINEIVFQTRLLSFNAAIEAARADQNGKGFGVVAEEVGKLAQASGTAAEDISKMLDQGIRDISDILQNNSKRVAELMADNSSRIQKGRRASEKCGSSFAAIVNDVNEVSSRTQEMTAAVREQSRGLQDINQSVSSLSRGTEQNSITAQSALEVSQQLKAQFQKLDSVLLELEKMDGGGKNSSPIAGESFLEASSDGRGGQGNPFHPEASDSKVRQVS